jgi:hypothetical protein
MTGIMCIIALWQSDIETLLLLCNKPVKNNLTRKHNMTCRGYDAKAVKISKSVKRAAALIHDDHVRGAFVRSFTVIEQDNSRNRTSRNKGDK